MPNRLEGRERKVGATVEPVILRFSFLDRIVTINWQSLKILCCRVNKTFMNLISGDFLISIWEIRVINHCKVQLF
jgi:hypothetical protein